MLTSSTVTLGDLPGLAGAAKYGTHPHGRRHSTKALARSDYGGQTIVRGRKLVVQTVS